MEGISPTLLLFPEWTIPTVEKDDILEWPPDCEEGANDERLLWLSENPCLTDLGLPAGETRGGRSRKLGLSASLSADCTYHIHPFPATYLLAVN